MYAPLQLLEQIKNYIQIINGQSQEKEFNKNLIKWMDKRCEDEKWRMRFIHDFVMSRPYVINGGKMPIEMQGYWDIEKQDLTKCISGLVYNPNDEDFFGHLMQLYINTNWRFHKLAYKIEPYFVNEFLNMKTPDSFLLDRITNLPSECFYVDYSNSAIEVCENLEGSFFITKRDTDGLYLEAMSLIRMNNGRVMPVFTQWCINLSDIPEDEIGNVVIGTHPKTAVEVECEDGVSRHMDESKLFTLYINFLMYLHVNNRDIEVSEQSKTTVVKPINKNIEPKNKFKEVREYKLGYKYVNTIKKTIIGNKSYEKTGRTVSSHFRSGHWHHYWTGHGEDKKLVLKYVEGTWVNGKKEEKVAQVRRIK